MFRKHPRSRFVQNPIRSLCLLMFIMNARPLWASWVDPDTPVEFRSTLPLTKTDQREYTLVFSDEFEKDGRTFNDGYDPRWTAIDKNDYTNAALHYYSQDNAVTSNGVLNITTEKKVNWYKAFDEKKQKFYSDRKFVQSAMVQGWNKFCITGGIVEFSAKLPGDPFTGGLWPALWLLGNLARATYVGSSDYMWPYSFRKCDPKNRKSQEISGCDKVSHYGMEPYVGRGAPEIDILETMQGDQSEKLPNTNVKRPYLSASYQVAPGIDNNRPILGQLPHRGHWYTHLEYGNKTAAELNPFFYGVTLVHEPKSYTYQSDALSANMHLNESHYHYQHVYRIEWEPPEADGNGGYIKWYVDGDFMYAVYGDGLAITGSEIPSEPMYLIINTAVSSHWGFPAPCPEGCDCKCFECGKPDCACGMPSGYCDNFPAYMEVDYVRVYQAVNDSKHILGCSTKTRPTEQFIEGHAKRYMYEGDKRPLQPIQRGGGSCTTDHDCGGKKMGECNPKCRCECRSGFTGPMCLTHDGFYDNENKREVEPLEMSFMWIPPSLFLIVVSLVVGFAAMLAGIIRRHKRDAKYHKISNGSTVPASGDSAPRSYNSPSSYQNSGSTDYALPTNQKVVTYCVIDGRLIDP